MLKRILKVLLIVVVFISSVYTYKYDMIQSEASEEWQFIHFENPPPLGELIYEGSITPSIELWHYSGGYWGAGEIRVYDRDAGDNWNDADYIADALGIPIEFFMQLPSNVVEVIENNKQEYEVVIEFNNNSSTDFYSERMFKLDNDNEVTTSINPKFKIKDNKLTFLALPKFNCFENYRDYGVAKYIPKVMEGYGRNVYSIFDKETGAHLGRALGTHSGEEGFLDYRIILDKEGNLEGGHTINAYDNYALVGSYDSGDITIGRGTFNNAGAVGMQFWYPMKISIYAKGQETATAHIKHFKRDGSPLSHYDYTTNLIHGEEHTITPSNVYKHQYIGTNIGFDTEATGIISGGGTHTITHDGTFENVYINYYYDEITGGSNDENQPLSSGRILADERGNEKYDVTKGIPVLEDLYVNLFGKEYLFSYSFSENVGSHSYPVEVTRTYKLVWKEDLGEYDEEGNWQSDWREFTDYETVTEAYDITREYSYWTIDHLEIYKLKTAEISNDLLSTGKITLTPNGYIPPSVDLWNSSSLDDHLQHPATGTTTINLGQKTVNGGRGGRPSIPNENWSDEAEGSIGEIKVRNDKLTFNSTSIMEDSWFDKTAPDPGGIPDADITDHNVFYQGDITIDVSKANGSYPSTGRIIYTKIAEVNSTAPEEISDPIEDINPVIVHNPVISNSAVWNDSANNQEINPDGTRAALILDRSFRIQMPTSGQHKNILGYGNRDYEKYTQRKEVRFPFDVYYGTNKSGSYIRANTWHSVDLDEDIATFYLPIWVEEGNYTVEFRQTAVNAIDATRKGKEENQANFNIGNYVATKEVEVRVIGRLYGFKITDIKNYPLWQLVFRENENTASHTGNYYWVGTKDQEENPRGNPQQFTLPLLEGSHPDHKTIGALKTGYSFKFQMDTIGNYYNDQDCISIHPTFYYINKDGTNRQEVDIYYTEAFGGRDNHFVKLKNNPMNRSNTKYIKLGDIFRNVPLVELRGTSRILGILEEVFKDQEAKVGWFDWMVLSKPLRTFIGEATNIPSTVDADKVIKSSQRWYGEYYLPNNLYVAPKGYNVVEHSRTNNGLHGKEDFWLKEGFIIVNFKIETIKNGSFGNPILGYWNGALANMWRKEGYRYSKTDGNGITFNLQDGDVIFYYANKRASDDYQSGGTH